MCYGKAQNRSPRKSGTLTYDLGRKTSLPAGPVRWGWPCPGPRTPLLRLWFHQAAPGCKAEVTGQVNGGHPEGDGLCGSPSTLL